MSTVLCCCCFLATQILRPCWKQAGDTCFFSICARQREERSIHPFFYYVCRLLLTCLSQKDSYSLWLQRIHQQPSVCSNLCFIMNSSTNSTELLLIMKCCLSLKIGYILSVFVCLLKWFSSVTQWVFFSWPAWKGWRTGRETVWPWWRDYEELDHSSAKRGGGWYGKSSGCSLVSSRGSQAA